MSDRRKRILFVNYTAGIAGPSNSLFSLLMHIKDRYDTVVLIPEEGPLCEWLEREGIPVRVIPEHNKQGILKMARLVRSEKFDLVYGNNPDTYARNALIAARLVGRPFIWHFRSVKWHWGWSEGVYLRLANRIIAVSRASAAPLARFVNRERIQVIYNGVDTSGFQEDPARSRAYLLEQTGIPAGAQILISVGHLNPRKAQARQVEIVRRLASNHSSVHLLMVGSLTREPRYVEEVRRLIAQYGLEDRVHVVGLRSDIPKLLAGSDIFLHTPKEDAHPRAVIEAMACGLPVVTTAVGGVAETVLDGQTGYLLEDGDCEGIASSIETLIGSPQLAAAFGEQARQRVQQHYTAAGTASKIDQVLQDLLKEYRN